MRFVGHPIAFVVAADRAAARDAADLVEVDYDPLPAVVDPERAAAPDAPQIYDGTPGNTVYELAWSTGDVDGAFARAHRVVRGRFVNQRIAALPMDCHRWGSRISTCRCAPSACGG